VQDAYLELLIAAELRSNLIVCHWMQVKAAEKDASDLRKHLEDESAQLSALLNSRNERAEALQVQARTPGQELGTYFLETVFVVMKCCKTTDCTP
jgi:hypothetical protein